MHVIAHCHADPACSHCLHAKQDTLTETERRYEEAARKLLITETDLEKAEERAETAEGKLKALTVELNQVSNELRTLNARYGPRVDGNIS